MKINHEITLDVARHGVQATIPLTQHEAGVHRLIFDLYNGSVPIEFGDRDRAVLYVDGDIYDSCIVYAENGVYPNCIVCDLSAIVTRDVGEKGAVLQIYKDSDSIAYSPEICFVIREDKTNGSKVLNSPQYSAVVKAQLAAEQYALLAEQYAEAAGDASPHIRINSITGNWEISRDGGETWVDTGMKSTGVHIGSDEPTEPGVDVWINPLSEEESEIPVSEIVIKQTKGDREDAVMSQAATTKLVDDIDSYVSPEMLGYKDGEDCTPYAQRILNEGAKLKFLSNKIYRFDGELTVSKTGTKIVGEAGTNLFYYGNGNFITIVGVDGDGRYASYCNFMNLTITAWGGNAAIYIIGMAGGYFENVSTVGEGNNYGFYFGDGGGHFVTSTFIRCTAQKHNIAGFCFLAHWTHQVNNITMLHCMGSSNGEYGFNIGGIANNIVGGSFESNRNIGFGFNGTCNGINVIGTYSENNTNYDWYLPKEDSLKKNILVINTYDLDNKTYNGFDTILGQKAYGSKVYSDYADIYEEQYKFNICFTNRVAAQSTPYDNERRIVYGGTVNSAMNMLASKIKNGSKVNIKIAEGDITGSMHGYMRVNIDGVMYNVLPANTIARQIVSFETAADGSKTYTLNESLGAEKYNYIPFNDTISSKFMTIDECIQSGLFLALSPMEVEYYRRNVNFEKIYKNVPIQPSTPLPADTIRVKLPYDLNVGDYVLFHSGNTNYITWNIEPKALNTVKTTKITIDTSAYPDLIKENLCLGLYASGNITNAKVDYISIT
jgi:hypothetical protein